jgi:hypothetical protein
MRSPKVAPIILTLAAGVALCAPSYTHAQATAQRGATPQRTSPQPRLFDASDTVILLLDHQAGPLATIARIPVITTASEPGGPNASPSCADCSGCARVTAKSQERMT